MKTRATPATRSGRATAANPLPPAKRALDLACCVAALPALALLTLGAFMLTRLKSPGPLFFRQERVGYLGRRFCLYKFRTMHASAGTAAHQAHWEKLTRSGAPMQRFDARGDTRLIPGAWLLRATGLDELPQIINVLRGEMSIVGPRPCLPYEYDQYSARERQRCTALPGLTGLWQVSGKNRRTFAEMIDLDLRYTAERSFRRDVEIILRTPAALLLQLLDTQKARRTPAAQLPLVVRQVKGSAGE